MISPHLTRNIVERTVTMYLLSFATAAAASRAYNISWSQAAAFAILPAGLETVRGLIAGAFGHPHDADFTSHTEHQAIRRFVGAVTESAISTYIIFLVSLISLNLAFHVNAASAALWALIPAGLDIVRGLIAGAFGHPHDASFTSPTNLHELQEAVHTGKTTNRINT